MKLGELNLSKPFEKPQPSGDTMKLQLRQCITKEEERTAHHTCRFNEGSSKTREKNFLYIVKPSVVNGNTSAVGYLLMKVLLNERLPHVIHSEFIANVEHNVGGFLLQNKPAVNRTPK